MKQVTKHSKKKKPKQNWTKNPKQTNKQTKYKNNWKINPTPKQHNKALAILQT